MPKMSGLFYRLFPNRKTLTMEVTIASVEGSRPLIGLAEEVEAAWKKLMARFGVKERRRKLMNRTTSDQELDKLRRIEFRRGSGAASNMAKFKQMDTASQEAYKDDVYHPDWTPPKFDRNDSDYGRPKQGSLTEQRGIAAGHHIGKEIVQLCEVITENGIAMPDGRVIIKFGDLFNIYNYISDKVVGMLLRARKHQLVDFEGEMLFQRRDEAKVIVLNKPLELVQEMYATSNDPAVCLAQKQFG